MGEIIWGLGVAFSVVALVLFAYAVVQFLLFLYHFAHLVTNIDSILVQGTLWPWQLFDARYLKQDGQRHLEKMVEPGRRFVYAIVTGSVLIGLRHLLPA